MDIASRRCNATDTILAHAREPAQSERAALIGSDGSTRYAALADMVDRAAAALIALGLRRGERVALLAKDSPLFCAAFLGAMKAGGVAMALNPRLSADELSFIFSDSEARLALVDPDYERSAVLAGGAHTQRVSCPDFMRAMERAAPMDQSADTSAGEPAFWLYSSGTTGTPKAIIHSHANAAHAGKLLREVVDLQPGDVVLATSKLFFAFALDNAFLGALSCGATTILDADGPEPERVIEQAHRHRPRVFFTVPTFFRRLLALDAAKLAPLGDIPFHITGGERLPDAVYLQWRAVVGIDILVAYGMSETFCNATANFPHSNRPGSVGVPLAGVQMRLLDQHGGPAAAGEPGVLWLRHPSLALRYKNAVASARAFRDGWFCSGDLFTVDADGYWTHQGRGDELHKVAGQWVKPSQVEEAVLGDSAIREAACVVVADRDGFERLALYVVPGEGASGTAATLAAARCAASLPPHCRPKWVHELPELPRTATGKIQRYLLKELFAATPPAR